MANAIGTPGFSASGTIASAAASAWYPIWFPFNLLISGTWSGTWAVEVSADNGATAANCTIGGIPSSFSTNGFFVAPNVFQKGLLYRIARSAGTGTLAYTISGQGAPA